MAIFKATTPTRISLAGGGTDVDPYSKHFGGAVINMAINIYQHVELYIGDDMWSVTNQNFPYDADPKLFYKILTIYGREGMHKATVVSDFDGFMNAGLGSSGSAAVCLIGALRKEQNKSLDRLDIVEEAYDIEVNKLKWHGGRQDQIAAAFGGLNSIGFGKKTTISQFTREDAEALKEWMVLFYIGKRQSTSDKIQRSFKKLSGQQIASLNYLRDRVISVGLSIQSSNFELLGKIIDELWQYKKESNKNVSNSKIDEIYDYALKHGAIGGKLMGAGGGGYMFFICDPKKQHSLIFQMAKKGIENIDFSPDFNGLQVRRL
mgnify:CR=1 FL=1